ncbi:MAG: choice-of-anchor B family protein, partial [Bacteroidetes bacterium]|nr:choice-of-anchor B family protein [Bacteroidota bacterium]
MKKTIFTILVGIMVLPLTGQNLHVNLFGKVNPEPIHYAGCWGWTSPTGEEYALIGAYEGTYFISIDDSTNLFSADFIPGPGSNWREMTVVGDYGFIVTEGLGPGRGLQVVDLSFLPDSVSLIATFDSTFATSHIISKNIEGDSYVYISGTNTSGGVHIIDISQPDKPVEVGVYDPGYYIHDCHVRGNRLYAAAFYQAQMDVVDISDRSNPVKIASIADPQGNTHSSWTTRDHNFLFATNELDGTRATVWDIRDISDIEPMAHYSANLQSLVHNPYIREDYAFISHNTEGLRVVDLKDPTLPVEVGYYDTWPGSSGGFHGLWSAFPFFPSGKIIGANRHDGLYIFTFDSTSANRIYGVVVDSIDESPIASAQVIINGDTLISDFQGKIAYGFLANDTANYSLQTFASGYFDKTLFLNQPLADSTYITIPLVKPDMTSVEDFEINVS